MPSTPSFCGFEHCHPYILLHFGKCFYFLVLYTIWESIVLACFFQALENNSMTTDSLCYACVRGWEQQEINPPLGRGALCDQHPIQNDRTQAWSMRMEACHTANYVTLVDIH